MLIYTFFACIFRVDVNDFTELFFFGLHLIATVVKSKNKFVTQFLAFYRKKMTLLRRFQEAQAFQTPFDVEEKQLKRSWKKMFHEITL